MYVSTSKQHKQHLEAPLKLVDCTQVWVGVFRCMRREPKQATLGASDGSRLKGAQLAAIPLEYWVWYHAVSRDMQVSTSVIYPWKRIFCFSPTSWMRVTWDYIVCTVWGEEYEECAKFIPPVQKLVLFFFFWLKVNFVLSRKQSSQKKNRRGG